MDGRCVSAAAVLQSTRTYKVHPSVLRWDGGSCYALQCCSQSIESRPFQYSLGYMSIAATTASQQARDDTQIQSSALPSHAHTRGRAHNILMRNDGARLYGAIASSYLHSLNCIQMWQKRGWGWDGESSTLTSPPPPHPPLFACLSCLE